MESPAKTRNTGSSSNKRQKDSTNHDVCLQKQEAKQTDLTYDELRMIFKYLSAKDLCNVALTCRSWRDAASSEVATRQAPEYFLKNFQVNNEEDSEGSYNASMLGLDLRIKPHLGLIFEKRQRRSEWTPKGCYCENLPSDCCIVTVGGYNLVADDAKIGDNFGTAVSTFLPQIPDLKCNIITRADSKTHDEIMLKLLPEKNEKSKCVILLTNYRAHPCIKRILPDLQMRYEPGTLAFWGGMCVDLKLCNAFTCSKTIPWVFITLSSPSLQSWSTLFLRYSGSDAHMEKKLRKEKERIHLKKHSLGLMFACCARMHKKDKEIEIFKKVFPTVPLVGLHGDGEFGLHTLHTRDPKLHHAYSTAFMILTYD